MFKAYLEGYRLIKIIGNEQINSISIMDYDITIECVNKSEENNEYHYYFKSTKDLLPYIDYYLLINNFKVHLNLGKIARSKEFDEINYYPNSLGVEYHKDYSIFRLWTPVAKEVILVLNDNEYQMSYLNNHWEIKVNGNLYLSKYYYKVRINEEFIDTLDPYGISSDFKYNYVIDLDSTLKLSDYSLENNKIIYEAHLKDLSYPAKSYYKESIKKIHYLKNLGITYLQIMPINLFYGIDMENKDALYNWGYNPIEYIAITPWYAEGDTAVDVINEFKEMIDNYHQANIGIVLDVVFNHVYKHNMFSYGKIVPGYVFRCDDLGFMTNGSLCGNDLKTESMMIRKLIVDTVKFYASFYKVDGFRFDLMGLVDIETLKEVEVALKQINPNIILYGEGWNIPTGLPSSLLGNIENKEQIKNYSFFNGLFRDTLLGNQFNNEMGYLLGKHVDKDVLIRLINGFDLGNQSINYVECHDNYTLFDYLTLHKISDELKKDILKLALGIIVISKGTPFIHLGMEVGRSKKLNNNSYKSDMSINSVNLKNDEYADVIKYLKGLIVLRKTHPIDYENINLIDDFYLHFISNNVEYLIKNDCSEVLFNEEKINKPGLYYKIIKRPLK